MDEMTLEATVENLNKVIEFVDDILKKAGCSEGKINTINVAIDEIYSNIANYAYSSKHGIVTVEIDLQENPLEVTMNFIDSGKPYNPLKKEDPDVTLSAEDRAIGGLGIFIIKEIMDEIVYEYKDSKNILKVKKII